MRKVVLTAAVAYGDYCFSGPGGVRIRVALDGNKVNVNAISTLQWVGVGFPQSPDFDEMAKGNFVIGGGNNIYERRLTLDTNGKPDQDFPHAIPGTASVSIENGVTNMSFSRLLAPPGGNAIDMTKPLFLWATGSINSASPGFAGLNYHGPTRGNFRPDFKNGNCPADSAAPPAQATGTMAEAKGDYCFSEPGGVRIRIGLDGDKLNVNAISTTNWVGVGFPKSPDFDEMPGGNFIIAGGNNIYQRRLTLDANGRPNEDFNHAIPGTAHVTVENGVTNVSFSRLLAPPGANAIDLARPLFLWASGSVNSAVAGFAGANYHGPSRGHFRPDFKNGNCPPASSAPGVGKAGKMGKAKNAKNPKGKFGKAKGNEKVTVCTGGQVPCTAELQRQGMNCVLNACVSRPASQTSQPLASATPLPIPEGKVYGKNGY